MLSEYQKYFPIFSLFIFNDDEKPTKILEDIIEGFWASFEPKCTVVGNWNRNFLFKKDLKIF